MIKGSLKLFPSSELEYYYTNPLMPNKRNKAASPDIPETLSEILLFKTQ